MREGLYHSIGSLFLRRRCPEKNKFSTFRTRAGKWKPLPPKSLTGGSSSFRQPGKGRTFDQRKDAFRSRGTLISIVGPVRGKEQTTVIGEKSLYLIDSPMGIGGKENPIRQQGSFDRIYLPRPSSTELCRLKKGASAWRLIFREKEGGERESLLELSSRSGRVSYTPRRLWGSGGKKGATLRVARKKKYFTALITPRESVS